LFSSDKNPARQKKGDLRGMNHLKISRRHASFVTKKNGEGEITDHILSCREKMTNNYFGDSSFGAT
jgi:hypothetical protein